MLDITGVAVTCMFLSLAVDRRCWAAAATTVRSAKKAPLLRESRIYRIVKEEFPLDQDGQGQTGSYACEPPVWRDELLSNLYCGTLQAARQQSGYSDSWPHKLCSWANSTFTWSTTALLPGAMSVSQMVLKLTLRTQAHNIMRWPVSPKEPTLLG